MTNVSALATPTSDPTRVLIVDDEPSVTYLLREVLERANYDCLVLNDAREAVEAVQDFVPDLVLLDLWMPHLDGLELATQLREQPTDDLFLPIVMLTAQAQTDTKEQALRIGVNDFLEKPVSPPELRLRVSNLVQVRRLTQRLRTREDDLRKRLDELWRLAFYDSLTGAMSRHFLLEGGERALSQAKRYRHPLAVILIDLDHFKRINDRYGHAVGDEVLRTVAERIKRLIRTSDLFGRLGGEEFALVLPETDATGALVLAERVRRALSDDPAMTSYGALPLTATSGVATLRDADDLPALLERADRALYKGKAAGRDRVVYGE